LLYSTPLFQNTINDTLLINTNNKLRILTPNEAFLTAVEFNYSELKTGVSEYIQSYSLYTIIKL